ncbi:hypothetical protein PGB90_005353 [Kerria lacca]
MWVCLRSECLPVSHKERWLPIAKGFQQNCDFPNYLRTVDGRHFRKIKRKINSFMYEGNSINNVHIFLYGEQIELGS